MCMLPGGGRPDFGADDQIRANEQRSHRVRSPGN
jgi:hypothetical protein